MLLVVQLARLSSSLVGLPELPVLLELTELCSAAKNAPSMAWTAILAASLAAPFRQYQLGAFLAALLALLIQLSPK